MHRVPLLATATAMLACAAFSGCSDPAASGVAATTTKVPNSSTTTLAATTTSVASTVAATTTDGLGGVAHLTAVFASTNGADDPIQVTFTGAIDDTGTATQTQTQTADGETGTMAMTLTDGNIEATFEEHHFDLHLDAAACSASPTSDGKIVLTGGTGAYAAISGVILFTTSGTIIGATDSSGACLGDTAPPASQTVTVSGDGQVELG